jgi:hypothetical protein
MAKRAAKRAKLAATKRSSGKRKVHRTIPRTPDEVDENLPVVTEPVSHDPTRLAGSQARGFWSLPLHSLIHVDWSRRVDLFPHAPGTSRLQSVVYGNRTYGVESLDPRTMGNPDIELLPDCRYYIVPISEDDQSTDSPSRLLLIQSQIDTEEPGPYIVVIRPSDTPESGESFAHLSIIGGKDDSEAITTIEHTAGLVVAVLTATEDASPSSPTQPMPPPPPPPPQGQPELTPTEPDLGLMACLDYLNGIKAVYTSSESALTRVQSRFYSYLRNQYALATIPIVVGKTVFDERQGHRITTRSYQPRLAKTKPGVIVQVIKDGFKRGQEIVQYAEVVVNQPAASWLRRMKKVRPGRYYVEIQTTEPLAIEKLIDEATGHFQVLDLIYSILAILHSQKSDMIYSLATNLQRYADSSISLSQLIDSIYNLLKTAQLEPLRLRYARRDVPADKHFNFIILGTDAALDVTREIILRQAAEQNTHTYFVPPNVEWLKAHLQQTCRADDQICDVLARGIATLSTNLAFAPDLLVEQTVTKIGFQHSDEANGQELTPEFIATEVIPYLRAIADLQRTIDGIRRQESHQVIITSITQGTVTVGFQGGKDALEFIFTMLIPWKRAHAKEMAQLEKEKMAAEIHAINEQASETNARANETNAKAELEKQQARKVSLENSQLQLDLADKAAEKIYGTEWHNLSEDKKLETIKWLLPSVTVIAESQLLLSSGKPLE